MLTVGTRLAVACALVLAPVGQPYAHARLDASVPAADATGPAPSQLELTFSEEVDLKFTAVTLLGPGISRIKIDDPSTIDDGRTLVILIRGTMAAGIYTVDWRALSADGHKSQGQFRFTVDP